MPAVLLVVRCWMKVVLVRELVVVVVVAVVVLVVVVVVRWRLVAVTMKRTLQR